MAYLKKRYRRILLMYIFFGFAIVIGLKINGTGYRPKTFGGSGPLTWFEILQSYKTILIGSLITTTIGTYLDYLDFKNKNKEK